MQKLEIYVHAPPSASSFTFGLQSMCSLPSGLSYSERRYLRIQHHSDSQVSSVVVEDYRAASRYRIAVEKALAGRGEMVLSREAIVEKQ